VLRAWGYEGAKSVDHAAVLLQRRRYRGPWEQLGH
jgi:hypothetical protein